MSVFSRPLSDDQFNKGASKDAIQVSSVSSIKFLDFGFSASFLFGGKGSGKCAGRVDHATPLGLRFGNLRRSACPIQ